MTRPYLFGPIDAPFAENYWPSQCRQQGGLTFSRSAAADLLLEAGDSWESLGAKGPPGWQPEFVVLYLPYMTIPAWLWSVPVPVVALALDSNLLWHPYRRCLRWADLVLADGPSAKRLAQEGLEHVQAAQLFSAGRLLAEEPWPCKQRDIDILFVGNVDAAVQRQRLPWLGRLAALSSQWRVRIAEGVFGEDYKELLGRSRIVFNRSIRGECNQRVFEAVAAGALLFQEEGNQEVPLFLAEGREYIAYNSDNLEQLLSYYLEHEDKRSELATAAQEKLPEVHFAFFWHKALELVEQHWEELVQRQSRRAKPTNQDLLLWRTWQLVSSTDAADERLPVDLAGEQQSAHWHNALGVVVARQRQERRGVISASVLGQATGYFQRAVAADPRHVLARLNLAEGLSLQQHRQEASAEARAALKLVERAVNFDPLVWDSPHFPVNYDFFRVEWEWAARRHAGNRQAEIEAKKQLLRWRLHTLLGDLTGELAHYYEAALLCLDLPVTQAALGCALARARRFPEAVPHLQQAVAGDPFDTVAARALHDVLGECRRSREQRQLVRQRRLLAKAAPGWLQPEPWFAEGPLKGDELASIIILCCNQLEYTRQCLESLLERTRRPYELILVDNGSSDGTLAYLRNIEKRPGPERVVVIANEENLGFARGCNQGLAEAEGDYLVLLNNDTVLTFGWLEGLVRWSLHNWPHSGLVGAVSNCAAPPQEIKVDYRTQAEMDAFAARRQKEFAGQALETARLVGFCVLLRRDVLEKIGTLDERFGLGFFEDDDWGVRARQAGFRLLVAQDVFIHHYGNRTFAGLGLDAYQQLQDNFELFEKKWGKEYTEGYHLPDRPNTEAAAVSDGGEAIADEPAIGTAAVPAVTEGEARPMVSLCMIVKNEEDNLPACLESVAGLDLDMVIVDTGSTDRTRDIAREFGARVFDFAWVDSFAAARNESLKHARGQWIMWLDADETFDAGNRQRLQALLAKLPDRNIAFLMRQSSPLEAATHAAVFVDQVRLFRNLPGLSWQYRAHEQILPSLRSVGADVAATDIVIAHSGFARPPLQGAKVNRNLRLLLLDLEDHPGDSFILYNVGAAYLGDGDYAQALAYLQQSLKHAQPGDTLLPKLHGLLVRLHHGQGQKEQAHRMCRQGRERFPQDGELLFWDAVLCREQGDLGGCERSLLDLLDLPKSRHLASADAGLHGYRSRHLLAETYYQQQRLAEAEAQWRKAVAEWADFTPAWRELAKLWLAAGRWHEVPQALMHLECEPALAEEHLLLRGRLLLGQKEFAAARAHTEAALEEHGSSVPLRILYSHILLQEDGDWQAAETALEQVLQLSPGDAEARHNLDLLRQQHAAELGSRNGRHKEDNGRTMTELPSVAVAGQRPAAAARPKVSLCMIVKNEEDNLPACLESVAGLDLDMVIVDTGSTDRTRDIAREFGARVFDFAWVDSFAAARNESLKHARGQWIFWLDADDRLNADNRSKLAKLLAGLGDDNAAYIMKCLCLPDPVSRRETVVDHVRLFRNHGGLRWRYRVHEQILPALRQMQAEVRWSDIVIHHSGYQDTALRARKLERDLKLLEKEIEEQPGDPFTLFNLGAIYREQGKLAEAIPLFERSLAGSQPSDSIVRKLYVLLTQCHRQLGAGDRALTLCRQGREQFPTDLELLFQEGVAYKEAGDLDRAIASWQAVLNTDPGQHFASVDVGLRGYLTHHNLAIVYQQRAQLDRAHEHWQAVLSEKPDYVPALVGLAELYLQQQRWRDMEDVIVTLPESADLEAAVLRARLQLAQKEYAVARDLLQQTMAKYPQEVWPRVIYSHVLLQEGADWRAAEQALRDVLALAPEHQEARHNLHILLEQQAQ